MTDPQPEYVWAYTDEKSGRSRMWLMIGLGVVAIAVAVGVVLALLRPWESGEPAPMSSASASPSPSSTASGSPSPTATPTPSPTPTATPSPTPPASAAPTTPPPPADPSLPVFRGKVQPQLDEAATGLSFAEDASGDEGVQIADQLRDDAGRMSDTVAPRSIADRWRSGVQAYGEALDDLRAAFAQGGPTGAQLSAARSALRELNELVAG